MKAAAVEAAFVVLLAAGLRAGGAGDRPPAPAAPCGNVRLVDCRERLAIARALGVATRNLADPSCQGLLDELRDGSGRTLRENLDALGQSAPQFATSILFYDAPPAACRPAILALTCPGSRVVYVCGARFVRQMKCDSRHAAAVLVHELLHAAGLGEDPPGGDFITAQVRARCGGSGSAPASAMLTRARAAACGRERER